MSASRPEGAPFALQTTLNKTPEENLVPSSGKVRPKIVVRIRAGLSLAAPDI
jgi:hypothetical protein